MDWNPLCANLVNIVGLPGGIGGAHHAVHLGLRQAKSLARYRQASADLQ